MECDRVVGENTGNDESLSFEQHGPSSVQVGHRNARRNGPASPYVRPSAYSQTHNEQQQESVPQLRPSLQLDSVYVGEGKGEDYDYPVEDVETVARSDSSTVQDETGANLDGHGKHCSPAGIDKQTGCFSLCQGENQTPEADESRADDGDPEPVLVERMHVEEGSQSGTIDSPSDVASVSLQPMEFTPRDMAHGGSAIARIEGKAFFVDGVMPGETATGEIEVDKGSWGRIKLAEIVSPSPERVTPRCRHFDRCGGCQWQYAGYGAQLEWKQSIVAGQLAHLGGLVDPPVRPTVAPGEPFGYRNRMDYRIREGRPALHQRRSRDLVALSDCDILHPNLADVFADLGDLSGVRALTLRTSVATGDVLAAIAGDVPRHAATTWGCNILQLADDGSRIVQGGDFIEETVAGVPFRITGTAFFQNNTAGAEELVRLVDEAADVEANDTLLDAYAGGGLFAATVGRSAGRVLTIEIDDVAAADLHANLNRAGIGEFRIIRAATEDAIERMDEYWDVVIADPPRKGLGADGVDAITAASPRTVVYVSCDPASLARDAGLLDEFGYELDWVTPVDMFPQTFHIECVARFRRSS